MSTVAPVHAPVETAGVAPAPRQVFANAQVVSRSWFSVLRSRRLARGRVRAVELGGRRLAVYRDEGGSAHVLDARCPHLGADLALGTVDDDGVRCAFHGWRFGPDGRCQDAPGHECAPQRRTRSYPVVERWGFVWMFNGAEAAFPLPRTRDAHPWILRLPPQRIRCHPHLVLANGLDVAHYDRLHGIRFEEPPRLTTGAHTVSLSLCGRPVSRSWRVLSGTTTREIVARFTTIGGSLAWATVDAPVRFEVLFTGRPTRDGACLTQTLFFFPSRPGPRWIRALGVMVSLLHDDRRVLESLDFHPGFSETDAPLRDYARVVNALGAW
jgi:phenylpropionate dioxygenase-like ring-hydroxylating dioxygenase large terminal subunit